MYEEITFGGILESRFLHDSPTVEEFSRQVENFSGAQDLPVDQDRFILRQGTDSE